MKKFIIISLAILCAQMAVSAQGRTSLGIRLGAGTEFGGELTLGKYYGVHNRLDFGYGLSLYDIKDDDADLITSLNQYYNWQTSGKVVKWFLGAGLHESVEFSDGGYSAFNFGLGAQTGLLFDISDHFGLGIDARQTCKIIGKPSITNRWNTSGALRLIYKF